VQILAFCSAATITHIRQRCTDLGYSVFAQQCEAHTKGGLSRPASRLTLHSSQSSAALRKHNQLEALHRTPGGMGHSASVGTLPPSGLKTVLKKSKRSMTQSSDVIVQTSRSFVEVLTDRGRSIMTPGLTTDRMVNF
jgi:hypothetical protein